jgi:hypothetical protein
VFALSPSTRIPAYRKKGEHKVRAYRKTSIRVMTFCRRPSRVRLSSNWNSQPGHAVTTISAPLASMLSIFFYAIFWERS